MDIWGMFGGCWVGVWECFGGRLGRLVFFFFWGGEMFGGCLKCLGDVWGCLGDVWGMFGGCLGMFGGVWTCLLMIFYRCFNMLFCFPYFNFSFVGFVYLVVRRPMLHIYIHILVLALTHTLTLKLFLHSRARSVKAFMVSASSFVVPFSATIENSKRGSASLISVVLAQLPRTGSGIATIS